MRAWHLSVLLGLTLLLGACQTGPIFDRADETVREAKRQVDDSVNRAVERVDRAVESTKLALDSSVTNARVEYETALHSTGVEVQKIREDLKSDLADLDTRTQERLEQIRSSAASLISDGDNAIQARIDQIFVELRLFVTATIAQIKDLIEPILRLAERLGDAVEKGNEHIASVVKNLNEVLVSIRGVVEEVKNVMLRVQGKGPDGGTDWGAIIAMAVAAISGVVALLSKKTADQAKEETKKIEGTRASERQRDGERWKPEEIDQRINEKMALAGVGNGHAVGTQAQIVPPGAAAIVPPGAAAVVPEGVSVVVPPRAPSPTGPDASTPDSGPDPTKGPNPTNPSKDP